MTIDHQVPFYSNTREDTHCFQAALRMVLKYFLPEQEFTWDDLDKITAKVKDMWTWPQQGLIWMQDHGFEVLNIEIYDYSAFIEKGVVYLQELYGDEGAKEQEIHSDLEKEKKTCAEFVKKIKTEERLPTSEDIRNLLDQNNVLVALVNSSALNNEEGYVGHFVVIKGMTDTEIIFHDPGLPPKENRRVTFEEFEKGWAYPNDSAKNLVAFKLKG